MAFQPQQLMIVGAGFSANAGLPLASQFTGQLLDVERLVSDGPSNGQVRFLKAFVDKIFGEGAERSADEWPEMEDILTLVDLSANTGHHLGPDFSPSQLRVVRRAIIVRMIRMLAQAYRRRQKSPDDSWRKLEALFGAFDLEKTAILSMNWDTVFEQGVARTQLVRRVDYGFEATACDLSKGKLTRRRLTDGPRLNILKPHGSANWLYCDACRETFWLPPSEHEPIAKTLFRKRDWEAISAFTRLKTKPGVLEPACPHCQANALGTRFATFSYRKALDFPMHAGSWRAAEAYLKRSSDWVFFGYSMPAADFEFKHLLKRVQLSEKYRPSITVITGGSGADETISRFERFFGDVSGERTYFRKGLNDEVLEHLRKIGVLRASALGVKS